MRPFMNHDRVGLLPPGVGHKPAEPEAPSPRAVTAAGVLADLLSLTIAEQDVIAMTVFSRIYGHAPGT